MDVQRRNEGTGNDFVVSGMYVKKRQVKKVSEWWKVNCNVG